MSRIRALLALASACGLLSACGAGSSSTPFMSSSGGTPTEGQLLATPTLVQSLPASNLLLQLQTDSDQELLSLGGSPVCDVSIYHYEYATVGGAGESTTASGALMIPSGNNSQCVGARPIVLYAHGTQTEQQFDIANLSDTQNAEGILLAAFFAAQGYIVVAPNYAGYDTSSLTYHPFLVAAQQSKDMIDGLAAARSALPISALSQTTYNSKLYITGYSQGGFVAMATQSAMQSAGMSVTAAAPMSGPYALAAMVDAEFYGEVSEGAPVVGTMLFTAYQHSYGNIYSSPSVLFSSPYDSTIETLLPSTQSRSQLYSQGLLPQYVMFSATPPDPSYADITPPTTPTLFAPVFAQGFGSGNLITNSFRLSYLQDAQSNPDGGFPTLTTGVPTGSAGLALRAALAQNDLRNWVPTVPTLLCGGDQDPEIYFFNTQLMQQYWSTHGTASTPYVVLDLEAASSNGDPYATLKSEFAVFKAAYATANGGQSAVLSAYHSTLVPPFCLSAVTGWFASH